MDCRFGLRWRMDESVDFSGVWRYWVRYLGFGWINWWNAWFYWVWWSFYLGALKWSRCVDELAYRLPGKQNICSSFCHPEHLFDMKCRYFPILPRIEQMFGFWKLEYMSKEIIEHMYYKNFFKNIEKSAWRITYTMLQYP